MLPIHAFALSGKQERNGDLFLLIEDAKRQYVFTQRLDDADQWAVFSECGIGSAAARDVVAFVQNGQDTKSSEASHNPELSQGSPASPSESSSPPDAGVVVNEPKIERLVLSIATNQFTVPLPSGKDVIWAVNNHDALITENESLKADRDRLYDISLVEIGKERVAMLKAEAASNMKTLIVERVREKAEAYKATDYYWLLTVLATELEGVEPNDLSGRDEEQTSRYVT